MAASLPHIHVTDATRGHLSVDFTERVFLPQLCQRDALLSPTFFSNQVVFQMTKMQEQIQSHEADKKTAEEELSPLRLWKEDQLQNMHTCGDDALPSPRSMSVRRTPRRFAAFILAHCSHRFVFLPLPELGCPEAVCGRDCAQRLTMWVCCVSFCSAAVR